ncbi:DUF1629 domain-containing protein [Sphingobacterium sp. BN32]|uniref:imm11 family protein n=1 Tax=Sphingobacterium sp. BN32 TaxID=3058432 RepID=UPI00265CC07F|nr:DUF1629 domain-containing protein [Sphingobacterium sp. BN32]WKK59673.1 hypothetical protein QYC40_05405 [Sphingobacterium sp. BN32]
MYYNLRLDWDPKVIGVKNGIYQVELDKKSYDKMVYKKLDNLFISSEFTAKQEYPELDFRFCFKKLKSAKKTSFMSFSPYLKHGHFLVEKKTLELLEHFNIQKHKNYETEIFDSNYESYDDNYKLFYCVLQDWDVIDFEKSIFKSGGFGNEPEIEFKFKDENELRNFKGIAKVKTLALTNRFDKSLDFFHTRLGGLFVSEKLKLEFERNNTTGIKFTDEVKVLT